MEINQYSYIAIILKYYIPLLYLHLHTGINLIYYILSYSLWISNYDEFLMSDLFERKDIINILNTYKKTLYDLVKLLTGKKLANFDVPQATYFINCGTMLLKTVSDFFVSADFLSPDDWIIKEIKWAKPSDSVQCNNNNNNNNNNNIYIYI